MNPTTGRGRGRTMSNGPETWTHYRFVAWPDGSGGLRFKRPNGSVERLSREDMAALTIAQVRGVAAKVRPNGDVVDANDPRWGKP
jgi:hypothetical protein